MEIGNKKALLMTILMLVLFVLMLSELLTFVILTSGYNNIDQALAVGSTSSDYGKLLSAGASQFASASLSRALYTLANYEYTPSLRRDNFITNASTYLTYLMTNGTVPSVLIGSPTANTLAFYMGNLMLINYNSIAANLIGEGTIVAVNESAPVVFQINPYTLSVSYLERALINSTNGKLLLTIPVNATISLNGTPDLFYYQQGIAKNIRFSSQNNLTSIIGGPGDYASFGNTIRFAYGTVWNIPPQTTCANLNNNIPTALQSYPYNQSLILVTSDASGASGITNGCTATNKYGGVITEVIGTASSPVTVPYLVYPASSNVVNSLRNGEQVLLYGPGMDVLNIQNMINAVSNGYYFSSQFTPSYLARATGSFTQPSQYGIFTFSSYAEQAYILNGSANSDISLSAISGLGSSNFASIATWIFDNGLGSSATTNQVIFNSGTTLRMFVTAANSIEMDVGSGSSWFMQANTPQNVIKLNRWYSVVGTYSTGNGIQLYLNGTAQPLTYITGTSRTTGSLGSASASVGSNLISSNGNFIGQIANLQIYNTTLSSIQAKKFDQQGIMGVPTNNNGLVLWYQLNGKGCKVVSSKTCFIDMSGNPTSDNGVTTNYYTSQFGLVQNYSRDSIFLYNPVFNGNTMPVPGLLSCSNNAQCSNSILPHVYLGSAPIGMQQTDLLTPSFNGKNTIFSVPDSTSLDSTKNNLTIAAWILPLSSTKGYVASKNNNNNNAPGAYDLSTLSTGTTTNVLFTTQNTGFTNNLFSTNAIALDTWDFIAGVYKGVGTNTMYIYINGIRDSNTLTVNAPLVSNTGIFSIGGISGYTSPFQGNILNVQIYNKNLSSAQITQLYREGPTGLPLVGNAGLVGWYPLLSNGNDYSGYGNNATQAFNVTYSNFYISGNYNLPGLSRIATPENEWQLIGIPTIPPPAPASTASATGPLALDGSAKCDTGGNNHCAMTLTTAHSNDIVIVVTACSSGSGCSLTLSPNSVGLTFTEIQNQTYTSGGSPAVRADWALASSALSSQSINCGNKNGNARISCVVFAVANANTATPIDSGTYSAGTCNTVGTGTSATCTLTTTSSLDMLIGAEASATSLNGVSFATINTESSDGDGGAYAENSGIMATTGSHTVNTILSSSASYGMIGFGVT